MINRFEKEKALLKAKIQERKLPKMKKTFKEMDAKARCKRKKKILDVFKKVCWEVGDDIYSINVIFKREGEKDIIFCARGDILTEH